MPDHARQSPAAGRLSASETRQGTWGGGPVILSGQITRRQLKRKGEDEEKQRVQLRDTAMRAERVLFCRDWPSSVLSSHISMLSRIILGERREGVQPEPKKAIKPTKGPFSWTGHIQKRRITWQANSHLVQTQKGRGRIAEMRERPAPEGDQGPAARQPQKKKGS